MACSFSRPLLSDGISLRVWADASQNIHVSLSNQGDRSYFMLIGGLCNGLGTPAFQFVLRRNGNTDPLMLSYNSPGVICGNPDLWTVYLPVRSQYEFTFSPTELRLEHHMRQSLTDLKNSSYTLEVKYSVNFSGRFNPLVSHGIKADRSWWQGELTTNLVHRM